jgi:mono/diheme cytochrome c family protein
MRTATLLQALLLAACTPLPVSAADDLEFFETRIRPLLTEHCGECHSRQAGDPEGGLSFDSRADFLAAAGVAVAGDPDRSLLVQAVRYDGDLQMPPAGKLPPEAIRDLEEWVRRGLAWPDDVRYAETRGHEFD